MQNDDLKLPKIDTERVEAHLSTADIDTDFETQLNSILKQFEQIHTKLEALKLARRHQNAIT